MFRLETINWNKRQFVFNVFNGSREWQNKIKSDSEEEREREQNIFPKGKKRIETKIKYYEPKTKTMRMFSDLAVQWSQNYEISFFQCIQIH